jgi:DNA transformation protein
MGELHTLPNIGKELERQLHEAGIDTIDELKRIGSKEAWLRILAFDPSACLMRLSGLEGAIRGVRWHYLDPDVKADLKAFYHQFK